MPLSDVRLLPGSAFESAFATNLRFLKRVDIDALLLTWKLSSGKRWPAGSLRLMGWEHTGSELRGHFLGHWLSSASMSYAATGDSGLALTHPKVLAPAGAGSLASTNVPGAKGRARGMTQPRQVSKSGRREYVLHHSSAADCYSLAMRC